jgi:prepilin-type N-terminal cleavage/methylation domain-containing protein
MLRRVRIGLPRERGFTLLESLVALAMAALVIGAAVSSIGRFMAQKTLAGWSDAIVNDIRSAQQQAIAKRATTVVTFINGAPPSYAITIGGTTVRSQTLRSELTLTSPTELTITSATIQFSSLGIPSVCTPTCVPWSAAQTLTLTDTRNNQTVTISVAPITGAVTVQ